MGILRRQGGGWAAPSIVRRRAGGGWADVQNIYRRESGGWVLAWTAYTPLSISASTISGMTPGKGTFTIGNSAPLVTGGRAPLTFSIARISGSTQVTATQVGDGSSAQIRATSASTSGLTASAVFRWTVSDGITSATADFTAFSQGLQ